MAPINLLSVAATAAASDDVTVEAGAPVTVALKDAEFGATVNISLKDDTGAYQHIGALRQSPNESVVTISGPGTYRLTRVDGKACGVFRA